MDVKSYVAMEIKKEDRIYQLELPIGAPFGEVYDVVREMLLQAKTWIDEADKKLAEQETKTADAELVSDGPKA